MASGKTKTDPIADTAEGVELSREVLSTLAHELGGIASALDLRATAMSRVVSGNDLAALREIAGQIRLATKAARFARGADGFGMLNPDKQQSLDEWWRLAERFTSAVIPRGIAVETQFEESFVTATQASSLTWLWLAACKEVGELAPLPTRLLLKGGRGPQGTQLTAELQGDPRPGQKSASSRWRRFSTEMARELGSATPMWESNSGLLRWFIEIPT